ncbi:MAG: DUF2089 domain-containing protein [Turicibacter sp.]
MKHEVLGHCPVCESRLSVKTLKCDGCETEIHGDFALNKFNYLSKDLLKFTEVFIKNRGNIKEIEKELGLSYPTVRRMLDQTIQALGYTSEAPKGRTEILDQLENGEITVEVATQLLKDI